MATGPTVAAPAWSTRLLRWHLALAHGNLLLALGWTALRPSALLASPLHPEVLACVHLVTLGCIATTCIGAFHVLLPLVLRTPVRATAVDWALLVAVQLVASGVAAHMALGTYSGVAWSALLLLLLLTLQLARWVPAIRRAPVPAALRLGCLLAWGNLMLAVLLGGAMALLHLQVAPPFDWLRAVAAHAHVALAGFAGTLVAATSHRLLPMFLPAMPPPHALTLLAVTGLGAGGGVCAAGALLDGWLRVGQWLVAAGALLWLLGVATMLLRRRPRPAPGLERLLPGHVLAMAGVGSFALALATGTALLAGGLGVSAWTMYGSLLLLGGFGSFVLGIGQRLWPLAQRLRQASGDPHHLPLPALAWATAVAWCAGLAALPLALLSGSSLLLRASMVLLAAAVAADLANTLWRRRSPGVLLSSPPR